MLGEQLIKSDQIGLVEIVKNSYDADATCVSIDFQRFGPDFETQPESVIVITDNGSGMSEDTLRHDWMSPATPAKLRRKKNEASTPRGRTLQGEKGIGRFAVFKLGSQISLTTRFEGAAQESTLTIDISSLDNEPVEPVTETYLADIQATLGRRSPNVFDQTPPGQHGTRLQISKIRSSWNLSKVVSVFKDLERLQPLMWDSEDNPPRKNDFEVYFLQDGADLKLHDARSDHFQAIRDRAVLNVTNGCLDVVDRKINFKLNGRPVSLTIDDPEVRGLRPFKDRFLKENKDAIPQFECGPFGFEFYIFDLSRLAPAEHYLDSEDAKAVREHRIYLYRDGIRVYPYGDPLDDWLQIDVIRGTQSARSMFSNDQTVGYISISQKRTPSYVTKPIAKGYLNPGRQPVISSRSSRPCSCTYAASHMSSTQQPIAERVRRRTRQESLLTSNSGVSVRLHCRKKPFRPSTN